jgi:hypothetical protein
MLLELRNQKESSVKIFGTAATAIFCLALSGTMFVPSAQADESNRKTVITFSAPVEIPGVHLAGWGVLPAGTYVFKIFDSQSDRHIVQIFSQDEATVYATILAIPNYRLKATDKTVMTFRERPVGQPEALRAWFYPGRNWGEEFVYPKSRAIELAKETNTTVLYTPAEIVPEVAVAVKSPDEPVVVQLKQAPVMAIKPTGEEVAVAEVVTPLPEQEVAAVTTPELPASLPRTASPMPLIGLLGMLSLGGAFAIRAVASRLR